jgi:hypothetical protein
MWLKQGVNLNNIVIATYFVMLVIRQIIDLSNLLLLCYERNDSLRNTRFQGPGEHHEGRIPGTVPGIDSPHSARNFNLRRIIKTGCLLADSEFVTFNKSSRGTISSYVLPAPQWLQPFFSDPCVYLSVIKRIQIFLQTTPYQLAQFIFWSTIYRYTRTFK